MSDPQNTANAAAAAPAQDENQLIAERREKLRALREAQATQVLLGSIWL